MMPSAIFIVFTALYRINVLVLFLNEKLLSIQQWAAFLANERHKQELARQAAQQAEMERVVPLSCLSSLLLLRYDGLKCA
jgi:hypothetical protein